MFLSENLARWMGGCVTWSWEGTCPSSPLLPSGCRSSALSHSITGLYLPFVVWLVSRRGVMMAGSVSHSATLLFHLRPPRVPRARSISPGEGWGQHTRCGGPEHGRTLTRRPLWCNPKARDQLGWKPSDVGFRANRLHEISLLARNALLL